jgi:hypothetical protein
VNSFFHTVAPTGTTCNTAAGAPCTLDAKRPGRPLSTRDAPVTTAKVSDFVEYVCKGFKYGIFSSPEPAQNPLKSCTKHRPIAFAFACNLILPVLLRER